MLDSERFRLLHEYSTPLVYIGQWVRCEVLGEVQVCDISDAPILWPLTKHGKWRVPIVFDGLANERGHTAK
jgi:hypothetical protein